MHLSAALGSRSSEFSGYRPCRGTGAVPARRSLVLRMPPQVLRPHFPRHAEPDAGLLEIIRPVLAAARRLLGSGVTRWRQLARRIRVPVALLLAVCIHGWRNRA